MSNQGEFIQGANQLYRQVDNVTDSRVRELATLRLQRRVINDLDKGIAGITRIGLTGIADIIAEPIEEPRESPTVIEVQSQRPGLLRRLLG